ncbi:mycofactocin-coupled SDR family oxidoreductase [Nocardia vaccinii]|uniref:mycofactocin-coupled SDR family oxidoreductase n=1 Tax=Nocardia vaccinii TaxID=1822 RepID=UPI00082AD368|nr:mycofactocin-coupled SDR family oxidoreductase [Nocardia vaccinii]
MAQLDGKVALVTGAARGQGRAHALTLARHGADLVVVDLEPGVMSTISYDMPGEEELLDTAKQIEELGRRAVVVRADVRVQSQLDDAVACAVAEFGGLDILIANAGVLSHVPFWKLTDEQWSEVVETNLTGVWHSAKAVAPHMIERGSGAIVMTASINALEPGRNYAHYTAAKHGVIGLMKTVALELAPHGVRCNAVCPGVVDTAMVNGQDSYDMFAGRSGGTRENLIHAGHSYHVLKGFGPLDPQVVADAALWLVSDGAAAVTGTAVPIEAGHLLLTGVNPKPQA